MGKRMLAAISVLVTAGVVILVWQVKKPAHGPSPAATPGSTGAPASPAAPGQLTHLAQPAGAAQLPSYLDAIEAKARSAGKVQPEDVRDGMAAIHAAGLDIDAHAVAVRDFTMRIERLKKELALAPIQAELVDLAAKIRATDDKRAREALAQRYVQAASTLPARERADALATLERLQGKAP